MTLKNSWKMFKTSAAVLRSRRELATFPILSGVVNAIVLVALGLLIVASNRTGPDLRYVTYGLMAATYVIIAYVTIFFNAALISQADIALRGGDPSVVAGIGVAASKWVRLIPWALTTAVVSYLLRGMRGNGQSIVRRFTGVAGVAWQVVSFFVLPKLVLEDRSFVETVRDSGRSLKETWGENATGNLGLVLLKIVLVAPAAFIFGFAFRLSGVGVLMGVAVAALWLLAALTTIAALTGVYQTALYQYMCERRSPEAFAGTDLRNALSA